MAAVVGEEAGWEGPEKWMDKKDAQRVGRYTLYAGNNYLPRKFFIYTGHDCVQRVGRYTLYIGNYNLQRVGRCTTFVVAAATSAKLS